MAQETGTDAGYGRIVGTVGVQVPVHAWTGVVTETNREYGNRLNMESGSDTWNGLGTETNRIAGNVVKRKAIEL
jgi:hypothetical protein